MISFIRKYVVHVGISAFLCVAALAAILLPSASPAVHAATTASSGASTRPLIRLENNNALVGHFYTMGVNEAANAVNNLGFRLEGVAAEVYLPGSGPAGTVPFYRLLNPQNTQHFYTVSLPEVQSAENAGFKLEGVAADVYPPGAGPAGTVPFYRLINPSDGEHFYTASFGEVQNDIKFGFQLEGVAADVFPPTDAPTGPAPMPLIRLENNNALVGHFYTTSVNEAANAVNNLGFRLEGVAAEVYLPGNGPAGTVPFYRLLNPQNTQHFYTVSLSEVQSAENAGFKLEGVAADVYPPGAGPAGTVPFYRLINPSDGEHFYTASFGEVQNDVKFGFQLEGVAADVLPPA